jgi:hypothetical protein
MKQNPMHSLSKPYSTISSAILFGCLALLLSDCFLKQDRTTTIYGTITDQTGQPVDSILLRVRGVTGLKYDKLKEFYSNQNGGYEIMLDVPKEYSSLSIAIPFSNSLNPKFTNQYLGHYVFRNDVKTNDCCYAELGEKTKYDFQLIPK